MYELFRGFSPRQLETVDFYRSGLKQKEIAERARVSKQAISKRIQEASWYAYEQGERALSQAITWFVDEAAAQLLKTEYIDDKL